MKKSLVLMLTILLAASLFAGCGQDGGITVSYTHLTLPTKLEV